jgi:hypothetical protein
MRFPILSLLFALSLGSASAEESLTKRAHNQICGIEGQSYPTRLGPVLRPSDIHNAKLVDCKELLENDDIWNNAWVVSAVMASAPLLTRRLAFKENTEPTTQTTAIP